MTPVRGFALVEDPDTAQGIAEDIVAVPFPAKLPPVAYDNDDEPWTESLGTLRAA